MATIRILILTAKLNEFDGIADYARVKAHYLEKLGAEVSLYNLCDPVQCEMVERAIYEPNASPLNLSLEFEFNLFQQDHSIKWLEALLVQRAANVRLSIMLHELWYRTAGHALFAFVKSKIKRRLIDRFLKKVQPEYIFTNSRYNQLKLEHLGYSADVLPVYSNIRVSDFSKAKDAGRRWLNEQGLVTSDNTRIGLLFGGIDPKWKFKKTLQLLEEQAKRRDLELRFVYIGNDGASETLQRFSNQVSMFSSLINLGTRQEEAICYALAGADFGFCVTPVQFATRSGSLAAKIEAKLPILLGDPYQLADITGMFSDTPIDLFWDQTRIQAEGIPQCTMCGAGAHTDMRLKMVEQFLEKIQTIKSN
ncbi:MAG TPA: hypothetical protein DCX14_10995 [Flavobacteriales bacterium]|nr:hypothetical protein [Flavobacteriales bacterium]